MDKKYHHENRVRLFQFLDARNIEVTVTFAGSGDSGSIDDIEIFPDQADKKELVPMWSSARPTWIPETKTWYHPEPEAVLRPLREAIEKVVEEDLEQSDVDWYNNEGGQGEWRYTNGVITFNVEVNEITSETAYSITGPVSKYLEKME